MGCYCGLCYWWGPKGTTFQGRWHRPGGWQLPVGVLDSDESGVFKTRGGGVAWHGNLLGGTTAKISPSKGVSQIPKKIPYPKVLKKTHIRVAAWEPLRGALQLDPGQPPVLPSPLPGSEWWLLALPQCWQGTVFLFNWKTPARGIP